MLQMGSRCAKILTSGDSEREKNDLPFIMTFAMYATNISTPAVTMRLKLGYNDEGSQRAEVSRIRDPRDTACC